MHTFALLVTLSGGVADQDEKNGVKDEWRRPSRGPLGLRTCPGWLGPGQCLTSFRISDFSNFCCTVRWCCDQEEGRWGCQELLATSQSSFAECHSVPGPGVQTFRQTCSLPPRTWSVRLAETLLVWILAWALTGCGISGDLFQRFPSQEGDGECICHGWVRGD